MKGWASKASAGVLAVLGAIGSGAYLYPQIASKSSVEATRADFEHQMDMMGARLDSHARETAGRLQRLESQSKRYKRDTAADIKSRLDAIELRIIAELLDNYGDAIAAIESKKPEERTTAERRHLAKIREKYRHASNRANFLLKSP